MPVKLGIAFQFSAVCVRGRRGVIYGTVPDPADSPVERGGARTTTTQATGDHALPHRLIRARRGSSNCGGGASGLDANENVGVNAALAIGSINQEVTVKAEAPLVDSRSSTVCTLIDGPRRTELPTNGRNVISLATLVPGVSDVRAPQTFTADRSGPGVAMSGTPGQDYRAVFRDSGLNYPRPDAPAGVKLLTAASARSTGTMQAACSTW